MREERWTVCLGGSTNRRLSIDRPYKVRLRGYEVEGGGEGVLDGLPGFEDLCDDGFFGIVGVGESPKVRCVIRVEMYRFRSVHRWLRRRLQGCVASYRYHLRCLRPRLMLALWLVHD